MTNKKGKIMWKDWRIEELQTLGGQLCDEGYETQTVERELGQLISKHIEKTDADGFPLDETFQGAVDALMGKCRKLPMRYMYSYFEPSDLEAIRNERGIGPQVLRRNYSEAETFDHIHGAWLGRCAGCLLGKPFEGTIRPRMVKFLGDLGLEELSDYPWLLPGVTDEIAEGLNMWFGNTLPYYVSHFKEKCKEKCGFPGDDDTNYTVMNMAMFKRYGRSFTSSNVAEFWLANMDHMAACTAERVAYTNFLAGIQPPESALFRNPYREWIGARIRADFFGYVALGRPELAAEFAWRDARISHDKNGVYSAMWVAAMLSMAIGETDMCRLIEIGLGQIPKTSRLYEAITEIVKRYQAGATYSEMVDYIHARWNEKRPHHWTHAISNDQIVAIGLLYGEGDFGKSIIRTVQCCLDTDCNGATVGSIMGMVLGAKALPPKWTGIMDDTIHTGVAGYDLVKISDLAEEMFQLHLGLEKTLK